MSDPRLDTAPSRRSPLALGTALLGLLVVAEYGYAIVLLVTA